MRDLRGKIVLVTGGGSGLGRLLCVQFAKEGARVVTVDLRQNFLDETVAVVEKETGQRITTFLCDLANRLMIYDVAAKIKEQVGKVDVLVNNAVRSPTYHVHDVASTLTAGELTHSFTQGIVQGKTFLELTDEQIQKTMDVNTMAVRSHARAWTHTHIRAHQVTQTRTLEARAVANTTHHRSYSRCSTCGSRRPSFRI